MKSSRRPLLAVLVLAACGGGRPAPSARPGEPAPPVDPGTGAPVPGPVAEPRQLAAETAVTTAWDATITLPASWFVLEGDDVVRIEDPDRELVIALVAVKTADQKDAIARAWRQIDPDFALPVAQEIELPGRDGWEAFAQVEYVTKTEEQRVVVALASKLGDTWYVATIDGKVAALQRRGAQASSIILDMKVPGLEDESFADKTPVLDRERMVRFDAFVEEARRLAGVPGAAVAVVHGGKIVLEKGYGVRSLGGKKKVTPATLFEIGSATKALTTLLLARLVDQGKLGWETPVIDVLPTFALADAEITRKVTVAHTVCACTGMPRQDLEMLFEYAGWDPEERLASMKTMKPTTGFGETFQYSSLMVSTGGWIAAHVYAPKKKLGPAYDEAMQKLVFTPLGMKTTTLDLSKAIKKDHAGTHARGMSLDYVAIPVSYEEALRAVRPAGAAWSSVREMSRFVMLELAKGKTPDGKQLVSEENLLARRAPRIKIDENNAYGLGLFVTRDKGVEIVHHGGNTIGHTADVFMLPEHDVGVVVLSNAAGANAFRSSVRRAFLEIVFDGKPEAKENLTTAIELQQQQLEEELALIHEADAAWIDPLLGRYQNADLGAVELVRKGKTVVFDAGEWSVEIAKKIDRDGTTKIVTIGAPYAGFVLLPRQEDGRTTIVLDAGQQVYIFTPAGATKP